MCRTDLGVGVDPALLPPTARGLAQATPALSSADLLRAGGVMASTLKPHAIKLQCGHKECRCQGCIQSRNPVPFPKDSGKG